MLGGVFRPLGPLYCIQTNFPEEKNLVLLRWKGISRCCAQKSCLWEQRQKGKQVERGNLKPTGVFSQFSLDSLYNFNGGDCFPMLIRYLLQFLPVRFLTLLTLCFICAVSSPPAPLLSQYYTSLITLFSILAESANNALHLVHKVLFKYGWKDDRCIRFTREKKQVDTVRWTPRCQYQLAW